MSAHLAGLCSMSVTMIQFTQKVLTTIAADPHLLCVWLLAYWMMRTFAIPAQNGMLLREELCLRCILAASLHKGGAQQIHLVMNILYGGTLIHH